RVPTSLPSCSLPRPPPLSTPFPYTTLFRSTKCATPTAPLPVSSSSRERLSDAQVPTSSQPISQGRTATRQLRSSNPRSSDMDWRSEEHTSELQSRENLVCRLLLEKKKP